MKTVALIAVLAALAVCIDASTNPEKVALSQEQAALFAEEGFVYREDIGMYQKGEVRLGDYLFYSPTSNVPGIPNTVQYDDVRYRGNSTTRITALRMIHSIPHVPAHTWTGALGTNHLTIRLMSTPGGSIFTRFEFWGHYTDWV